MSGLSNGCVEFGRLTKPVTSVVLGDLAFFLLDERLSIFVEARLLDEAVFTPVYRDVFSDVSEYFARPSAKRGNESAAWRARCRNLRVSATRC